MDWIAELEYFNSDGGVYPDSEELPEYHEITPLSGAENTPKG